MTRFIETRKIGENMISGQLLNCCGVLELSHLQDYLGKPAEAFRDLVRGLLAAQASNKLNDDNEGWGDDFDPDGNIEENHFRHSPEKSGFPSFILFTEAGTPTARGKYGKQFAAWIEEEGLGEVSSTDPVQSSRTKNKLVVFTWTVNHKAVVKWCKANASELCSNPIHRNEDDDE